MSSGNSTSGLAELRADVLAEIVREGELMIQSQFQAHLASDQRAFTFGGLTLTAATAALGGAIVLSKGSSPDTELARISFCFAAGLITAGGIAVATAFPRAICFPGNEPKNWAPEHWPAGKARSIKQAKLEQAKILQSQIEQNRRVARRKGWVQRGSFILAYATSGVSGLWLAVTLGVF